MLSNKTRVDPVLVEKRTLRHRDRSDPEDPISRVVSLETSLITRPHRPGESRTLNREYDF